MKINNEFMNTMSRGFHKACFKVKQHSPEILVGVGVVGTVATIVMACKATLKVHEVVDAAKDEIDQIHESVEREAQLKNGEVYTQEMANQDLTITYAQTAWNLTKLYAPSVILGVASVGCLVGSTVILRKRNVALAAAFTAVDTGFKQYRGRLIERFGKELDRELRHGIKNVEVEEVVGVDEEGNEVVEKKVVEAVEPSGMSIYSVFFDSGNRGWCKSPELNKVFLVQQEEAANFMLRSKGIVTLNEVYEMIGAPRTQYGQIAGWVYSDEAGTGDNIISFGLDNPANEGVRDFMNLRENAVLLDFNCIGNILPYI